MVDDTPAHGGLVPQLANSELVPHAAEMLVMLLPVVPRLVLLDAEGLAATPVRPPSRAQPALALLGSTLTT
eukprot:COSAG02_NODE_2145_length_9672_cov_1198.924266_6_plen_71_part_00